LIISSTKDLKSSRGQSRRTRRIRRRRRRNESRPEDSFRRVDVEPLWLIVEHVVAVPLCAKLVVDRSLLLEEALLLNSVEEEEAAPVAEAEDKVDLSSREDLSLILALPPSLQMSVKSPMPGREVNSSLNVPRTPLQPWQAARRALPRLLSRRATTPHPPTPRSPLLLWPLPRLVATSRKHSLLSRPRLQLLPSLSSSRLVQSLLSPLPSLQHLFPRSKTVSFLNLR
jgi:hypothetical protein